MTNVAAPAPRTLYSKLTCGLGTPFCLLWVGWSVSSVGNGLTATALPLLAAYYTTNPNEVAFVSTAFKLPWLVFALVGGLLADKWDRRRAMVGCDSIRFAVLAGTAIAVSAGVGSVWLLAATAFLITTMETVYDSSRQSILPMLVSNDHDTLQAANSRLMSANVACLRFVGPAAGGLLFVLLRPLPFYIDAVSFVAAASLVGLIRGDYHGMRRDPVQPAAGEWWRTIRAQLGSGVVWLSHHKMLRMFTLVGGIYNMITMGQLAVLVLYVEKLMHESAAAYGLLLSSVAVGSIAAGFISRPAARKTGPVFMAYAAMIVSELAYGALGVSAAVPLVIVALGLTGAGAMIWNVNTVSLRQNLVPGELMGRVNGAHRLVLFGLQPVGAVLGGVVASAGGLRAPYLWGAPLALLITLPGWFLTERENRRLKESTAT